MDSRMYPQGKGGLKGKYVAGVLTFVNASAATVYTVNPSTKAVAFAGPAPFTNASVIMSALPTSDPSVAGQLWANTAVVTVSAG